MHVKFNGDTIRMFTTGGSVRKVGGVNQLSGFRYSEESLH